MNAKEIKIVISKEIAWCKNNPDFELSKDYRLGFIKGLEQVKYLVDKLIEKNKVGE